MSQLLHPIATARWLALLLALACAGPVAAQSTQPVWWPPLSLYGHPVSQPYFDFPTWARYSYCRPAPLVWGYDPFPDYGPCDGAPFAAPTVACEPGFVAHRPESWYFSADFAPLTVDHLDGFALASVGPFGPVVLSTEDLRTEFAASGKYTVGRRIFDCYRLEGTYQGFASWEDQRLVFNNDAVVVGGVAGVGNLSTFLSSFANPPAAGLDFANAASAAIRSNFQSAEINLRYWGDLPPGPFDVSFLVGARYLRIGEQFQFNMLSAFPAPAGAAINLQADTLNQLVGAQLGIEFSVLVTTRWWFDVDLKGGIFNNRVDTTSTQINNLVNNGNPQLIVDQRDRTAWLGDISIVGNWQMTPYWVLRMGYQAMFLNGVSLAQDQVVSTFFTNTAGPLNDMGKLAYHGPLLGIMANW